MRIHYGVFCLALSAFLRPPVLTATEPGPPASAISPEQIEADWLHQDELRNKPGASQPRPSNATVEQDAAGGVDGAKTGSWGFHTENEQDPWWQVDLGEPTPLGRMLLFNRCDLAERAARVVVLLSDDGKQFRRVYQHDGTVFYGQTDKKPATIDLAGQKARYLRLMQPGKNWFHLDEVEIYGPEGKDNLALKKPATQSSTSQWSVNHMKFPSRPSDPPGEYATSLVVERGLKLAESLRRLRADVDAEADVLLKIARSETPAADGRAEYMQARWAVRKMTLKNPLLDFDKILFVKQASPMFPHMSDQFYGWWSKPGGGIWVLEGFRGDEPQVRCLTADWPDGTFIRPDLSYDGKRVVFAYCKFYPHAAHVADKVKKEDLPEDVFYKIYEMNVDGSNVRQLTRGKYDDFDARYLPSGEIVFLSTRKGQALQCGKVSAGATDGTMLPDSYVRCGGGNSRPVPVFTLHKMDADGSDLCAISAFENFEWTPAVAGDGRIIYARWDYIDRFNGPFMSLWSTNPDGTNPQLVYGNYTKKPQCVFEARAIPNSNKLIFTACAHHSNLGGSLALLDRTFGSEEQRPLTRLTPEVPFPETEGWVDMYYASPFPLSEEHYLVAWSDRRLPGHSRFAIDDPRNPSNSMGIYLYDAFGNLQPLYRDSEISSWNPIPVRPRTKPAVVPEAVDWDGPQEGKFLLQDVYRGLDGIQRGSVARLRVIGVPPKVQPHMNSPVLGVSREDPGKFVLGTVPVEEDGSAYFRVPSGMSILFQALDRDGLAVQTMRSLTYVQPNQTLSCIGCHEHRDLAPPSGGAPLAAMREPSRLEAGPEGSWPLRYDRLVQPALDRLCVDCHGPDGKDEKARALDLTPGKSYDALLAYGNNDLRTLAFERDRSIVGELPGRRSKLMALLRAKDGHEGVRLDADALDRLATWMDTYAHRVGHFSDEQEKLLDELRRELAAILAE